MVGSTTVTLPEGFTDVRAPSANVAGDGRGGTKLTFTMTLFPPIGSPVAEFGYTAEIRDGQVPGAVVSALPVSPLDSPSFKGGAASYKGGAETGQELTAGASEIDANLLKLRDGAGDLLAGLLQLRDGAAELEAGLVGKAAPGAGELAAGAVRLDEGAKELRGGARQLADGAVDAKDGSDQLASGAVRLDDGLVTAGAKAPGLLAGLEQVDGGLALVDQGLVTMYGSIDALPAKAKPLHDGVALLRAGIGTKTTDQTLLYAVDQLRQQLGAAADGVTQMKAGVRESYDSLGCAVAVLNDAVNGASALAPGASPCYPSGRPGMAAMAVPNSVLVGQVSGQLATSRTELYNSADEYDQTTLYGGLNVVGAGLSTGAVPALVKVECGLDNTALPGVCDAARPGLLQGLAALDAGVTQLTTQTRDAVQAGVGDDDDLKEDGTLRGGIHSLQGGVDLIAQGGLTLVEGLGQLQDGSGQLATGNSDLAAGLGQLRSGAGRLATGAGDLADGTGQLSDGAGELSDGLADAADGSGLIADGLVEAADGAPQLRDGAQRLSDEGTKALVAAGDETAQDYGLKYAVIEAGAERASTAGMAFGAPEGAEGFTAYSLELAALDGEDDRNVGRALGGVLVFGLASGVAAGIHRRVF